MNKFVVFDPTKPDNRCMKCKHHQYLILSSTPDGYVSCLHSQAHLLIPKNEFPYITRDQGIHWWGTGWDAGINPVPICLKSYKETGGSK